MTFCFGKEEKIAIFLLALVITGSGILYFALDNAEKKDFASPYNSSSVEGDLVYFEGVAEEITFTKTGGHIIVRSGDTNIFILNGAGFDIKAEPGELITATGIVQNYKGEMEIYVPDPSDAEFTNMTPAAESTFS